MINSYNEFCIAFKQKYGCDVPECVEPFCVDDAYFEQNDFVVSFDSFLRGLPGCCGAYLSNTSPLSIKDGTVSECIDRLSRLGNFLWLVASEDPVYQKTERIDYLTRRMTSDAAEIERLKEEIAAITNSDNPALSQERAQLNAKITDKEIAKAHIDVDREI